MRLTLIKTLGCIVFLLFAGVTYGQVNLSVSVSSSEPVVLTGNPFFYNVNFAITSPNVPGNNVVIRDTLPAYVEYKGIANSSLISSTSFNSANRVLTINLVNPIPAGTSGSFQINCAFKKLVTPNNLQTANKVYFSASNATVSPVVSNTAFVTSTALPSYIITKQVESYNATNKTITWKINLDKIIDQYNCFDTIGLWGLTSMIVQDSIPAGGVFVSASDGGMETSPGSGIVQWVMNPSTVFWCYSGFYNKTVTVRYPSIPYGDWIYNYAKLKGTLIGNVGFETEGFRVYRLLAPVAGAGCVDLFNNSIYGFLGTVGDSANAVYFPFSNLGNVVLDHVSIEIPIPNQIQANQTLYLTTAVSNVYYVTNTDSVNQIPLSRAHYYYDSDTFSRPVLPLGTYIKKYIVTYDNVPPNKTYYFSLSGFKILPIDRNGNPVVPSYPYLPQIPCDGVGTCIPFGSNVTYTYNSTSYSTSCYLGIMPKAKSPDINTIEKKVLNPKFFVPGDTVEFSLSFYNQGDSIVNGVISDTLAPQFQFVPNSWSVWSYYPIPSNFKPVLFQNGQVLRFEYFGDTNKMGLYNCLRYKVVIRNNVPPNIYYNKFYLTADNIPNPLPSPYYWFSAFYGTATLTVNEVTSVTADKGVKGILDNKFLFYPTNASTINGSDVDYKLRVRNLGNTKLVNTVLVDDLPFKNDSRGSQFTPYMTSLPSSNQPNVSIFYSLDSNVCVSEITPPITPVGCVTPTWLNSAPSDLKTIKALKFLMTDSLAGGDSLIVTWKMSAPANLNAGDVAYNKFDYQTNRASDNSPLLTTSPNKVGIVVSYLAQLGEYVWLDSNQNGLPDESTSAGINGITVGLWKPGPDHLRFTSDDVLYTSTVTTFNAANQPGFYRFLVPPDEYYLKFSLDSCTYSPTTTITASNFVSPIFTLAPAQIKFDMNLGVVVNTVSIPGSYNTCAGAGVSIPSTIVSGFSQWKYVWQKSTTNGVSWASLSNSTTASLIFSVVSVNDSASYRLVMTKAGLSNCTITSNVLKLNVGSNAVSSPTVVPFVPICASSGFQSLSASGTNLLWYNTSVGGIGSVSAPLIDLSIPSTVTYFVGQGLGSCFTGRVPLPVEIKSKPASPIPGNYAPLCKSSGFLTLTASGSALLWYLNTVSGVSSTLPIAINLATPQTVTFFVSQVSNQCESNLAPIDVQVINPALPGVSDQTYCVKNQSIILTATGTNLLWYTSSVGGIGVTTAPSILLSSPATITYFVAQTVQGCPSPRASITTNIVSSISPPTVLPFITSCAGAGLEALSAIGINLLWYTDSVSGIGNSLSPVVDLSLPQTVTYFVSQSQNGCESAKTASKVSIAPNPLPLVSPSKWCASKTLKPLTATGANLLWYISSVGGLSSGIAPIITISTPANYRYYVSQKNGSCESQRVTALVEVVDSAVVSTSVVLPTCLGDTLKIVQTTPGSNLWQGPSGFYSTTNSLIRILGDNAMAGEYTLTFTNNGGCTATANFMVSTVPSLPTIGLGDISICKGNPLSIMPTTSISGYWLYPGGTLVGNNIEYSTTTYSLSGVYSFIRQSGTCTKKQSIVVSITNCPPIAKDDQYETQCDDTLTVLLANHPIANDIDSNQVLDLSGFSLISDPQHGNWKNVGGGKSVYQLTTPNFEGTDHFTYRICDSENPMMCDTAKVLIQVKCHSLFFPNAFTPNGDGKNDVYEVFYVPFGVKVSIQFYNRWGDLVYFSEDYKNDWSGKSNAGVKIEDELASGTYFMVANASNGVKVSKYVVLIR